MIINSSDLPDGLKIDLSAILMSDDISDDYLNGSISGELPIGNYNVVSNIIVNSDDILTLQPGTEFSFSPNTHFLIRGTLIAEGKQSRIIKGKEYILEKGLRADFCIIRGRFVLL